MSYIQSALTPRETIVEPARIHGFVFAAPVCWLLVALAVLATVSEKQLVANALARMEVPLSLAGVPDKPLGLCLLALSVIFFIHAGLYKFCTELAVTSKRIVAKFGFIRRDVVEIRLDKVESVQINQGILGRLFDFGSVTITGSGGTSAHISHVARPLEFRRATLMSLELPRG
jgi:uncharacterized membrane protein YdbT with pleckstrin-like domain